MAKMQMQARTRSGRCPTHGSVQAVKEVPEFKPPGLFWGLSYLGSAMRPYRCPECGQKVA